MRPGQPGGGAGAAATDRVAAAGRVEAAGFTGEGRVHAGWRAGRDGQLAAREVPASFDGGGVDRRRCSDAPGADAEGAYTCSRATRRAL